MYDLTILGAGPAGNSAAITAARAGARVLLLEKSAFPRHKVCGEFVSSESLHLLTSLLQSNQSLFESAPHISSARLFADNRILTTSVYPPAASIARFDLDAHLFDTAEAAGVDTRQHTTANAIDGDGPFQIRTAQEIFRTRAVINATGRWSNLTAASHSGNHPKWLGLKAHFSEPDSPHSVDLYFFEEGYCGVQPVELQSEKSKPSPDTKTRINVCAMVRADVASSFPEVFSKHPALHERSRHWQPLTPPVTTAPLIFRRPQPAQGNILLAGDAAGFVDPFVGDGISLALRSGTLAAQSSLPFLVGKITLQDAVATYRQTYEQQLLPVFKNSARIRRLFGLPKMLRIPLMLLFQNAPALTQYLVRSTR